MNSQFKIVFSGKILTGFDIQQVKQKLAALHKAPLSQIETLFAGQDTIIKIVDNLLTAQKIQESYRKAGAICEIEEVKNNTLLSDQASANKDIICPKCGFEQRQSETCQKCGIIFAKYQQQQEQKKLQEQRKIEEEKIQAQLEDQKAERHSVTIVDTSRIAVVDASEANNIKFEVLAYNELSGSENLTVAQMIYYANKSGIKLKQVKITLSNASVLLEAGALHFLKGDIAIENKIGGVGDFFKKAASKVLTNETAFKPTYRGTGEIYLEPSFGHFILAQLDNEEMITDKGMFLGCETSIEVGVAIQKGMTAGLWGGEGWFQTKLSGRGICVLQSPVPKEEIIRLQLKNETVQVDGNFALLRKGNIEFTVEKSTKSLIGTLTSGEGLLQTFRGTGEVWLAPTQSVYERLSRGGLSSMIGELKSSGTNTAKK